MSHVILTKFVIMELHLLRPNGLLINCMPLIFICLRLLVVLRLHVVFHLPEVFRSPVVHCSLEVFRPTEVLRSTEVRSPEVFHFPVVVLLY